MQIIIDTVKDSKKDIALAHNFLRKILGLDEEITIGTEGKVSLGIHPITTVTLTDAERTALSEQFPESKQLEVAGTLLQAMSKLQETVEGDDTEQQDPLPTIEQVIPHLAANKLGGVHFTAHNQVNTGVSQELPGDAQTSVATTGQDGDYPDHLSRLPATPSLAVDEDTDTAGVKWDATLHSESRAKVADGTWRKRRNAKNVVVPIREPLPVVQPVVELPVAVVPPPPVVVPPPPVTVSPPPSADASTATPNAGESQPVAAVAPPPPTATVVVPPPPGEAFVPVTTFRALMEVAAKYMGKRDLTSKDVADICATHGIESLQACFDNTALIPSVHTAMHKIATKVA